MSKASKTDADDDLRPLEPEVAKAFPTDTAVNEALRKVLRATKAMRHATKRQTKRVELTAKAKRRAPRS